MTEIANLKFEDLELSQKKFSARTQFNFMEDGLKYVLTDKEGSSTFHVSYNEVSRDRDFLVERNTWLANVGMLWLALGAAFTAMAWFGAREFSPSIWLFVGAACFGYSRLRTIRYTKVPTGQGTIFIIDDAQKDRILGELESRRADQLRRWHDFIDANEEPERQRNRFQWLRREGVLSEAELAERLDRLGRMATLPEIAGELALDAGTAGRALN